MTKPVVFISYNREDEKEKDQLLDHLNTLQVAGLIKPWSDDQIGVGANWEQEIERVMAQADVAILLVTVNFLKSDFILKKEVPKLLKRRANEGLTIVPIIAKPCAWKSIKWLAEINVMPRNGRPVWSDGGSHADEDLVAIAEEVADIIKRKKVIERKVILRMIKEALDKRLYDIAIRLAEEFRDSYPGDPEAQIVLTEAYYQKGVSLYVGGDFIGAINLFDVVLQLKPAYKNAAQLRHKAKIQMSQAVSGAPSESIKESQRILKEKFLAIARDPIWQMIVIIVVIGVIIPMILLGQEMGISFDTPTPPPLPPTATPVLVVNPYAPQPGRSKLYVFNEFNQEITIDVANQAHKIPPGIPEDGIFIDLDPGKYTYTLSIPSGARGGEVELGPDQTWGLGVRGDGAIYNPVQLYP